MLVDNAITPIVAAGHVLRARRSASRATARPGRLKLVRAPVVLAERMDVTESQGAAYSASDRVIAYPGDGPPADLASRGIANVTTAELSPCSAKACGRTRSLRSANILDRSVHA